MTAALNVENLVIGKLSVASEAVIIAEEVTHVVNHLEEAEMIVVIVVEEMMAETMDVLKN
jgi:hypothetical protein